MFCQWSLLDENGWRSVPEVTGIPLSDGEISDGIFHFPGNVLTYHLFQYILRYHSPCYFLIESLRSVYLFLFSCSEAEVMGYEAKLRPILVLLFHHRSTS